MKLNYYRFTNKIWFQFLISSLWFLILAAGGLLEIKPLWFRFALIPILGVPAGIFYVWNWKGDNSNKVSFWEYVLIVLFIGPISGIFFGTLLAGVIYYILKLFGLSLF